MAPTATAEKEPQVAEERELAPDAAGEDAPRGRSRLALVLGGALAVVLAAWGTFQLAAPTTRGTPRFTGPYTTELFPEKYQVNLSGNSMKRYLQLVLNVVYEAYDDAYIAQRAKDPLYQPYLQATVLSVCSAKTVEQVEAPANQEALMEELREELEPVLFPVHVGETELPLELCPESGLRPGLSADRTTFRGAFHEHVLVVDGAARTVRLDDGPPVPFEGDEDDLSVTDAAGDTLFLDVTRLEEDFEGDVPVGVHGRIRRVLPKDFLVQ